MTRARSILALSAAWLLAVPAAAQQRDWSKVELKTQQVAEGIHVIEGAGGNIGVCSGDDGVFLIDDQFAPLTDRIKAEVAKLSPRPIRFLLNTHHHGDHVGGNENLGKSGVLIVAHDNVRTRLATEQIRGDQKIPPSPKEALPVVTFNDSVSFHLNGHRVLAFHVAPAHTDGDAVVWFRGANVMHLGDCFFNGRYPVIDVDAGGSLDGMIAAADRLMPMIDDRTRLIPGHGPLGDKAAYRAFRDMLAAARDQIRPLVRAGRTVDEIVAAKPTAALDEKWGQGGMTAERFVRAAVAGMARP